MTETLSWFFGNLVAAPANILFAIFNPTTWLNWSDPVVMMRFIYYGASVELFFAVLFVFLVLTIAGLFYNKVLWAVVRGIETMNNAIGRVAAWAAILMVLQQILIVFLQRIFRVSEISVGPFGMIFTRDLSWYGEELKLYNAIIVALACAYTFIQGGHVRVDLVYAGARFRTKRIIDMVGSFLFMMPAMIVIWLYAWFFMWRHLVTPKVAASDKLELLERKARVLKWNVETIGFSPNGFDAYFLFKILLTAFAGLMFLQAVAFFYRSYLECIEGPDSAGKYLDKDRLGDEVAETVAAIH